MGPGNQGFVELNGVGGLVLGAASAEVADHAGEGRQPESRLDDPVDEVVGFGRGFALGLGRGPIRGIPLQPCGRGMPGRGPGPICGVGRGRGTLVLRGSFLSCLSEVGNPGWEGVFEGLDFFVEQLRFVEFAGLIGLFGQFLAEFSVFSQRWRVRRLTRDVRAAAATELASARMGIVARWREVRVFFLPAWKFCVAWAVWDIVCHGASVAV